MAHKNSGGGCLWQLIVWAFLIGVLAVAVYLITTQGWEGATHTVFYDWMPAVIDILRPIGEAIVNFFRHLPQGAR